MGLSNCDNAEYGNRTINMFLPIALALSYYLSQYASVVPGITLGELVLVLSVILLLVQSKGKIRVSNTKVFLAYYGVALTSSVIALIITKQSFSLTSLSDIFTRWLRYFGYVVFYVAFCDGVIDKKKIVKAYKVICIAVAIYAILQYVLYLLFHIYLPVNILPLTISRDVSSENLISVAQASIMRARGVFVEPGYLAKFLLPGIILSFCGWEKFEPDRIDWRSLAIIAIAIMMSGSVQGIVTLLFSVLIIWLSQKKITAKHLLIVVLGIVLLLLGYYISKKTGFMARPINRIVNLIYGSEIDRSTQLRVFRGFAYWWKLPLENKIFGVGMGNAANYAYEHKLYTSFDYYYRTESTLGYMSGISSILVTHGMFCAVFFVGILLRFKKVIGKAGFLIYMQYVILLFGGGAFLSILGVLYLGLSCCDKKKYYKEIETNGIYQRTIKSGAAY